MGQAVRIWKEATVRGKETIKQVCSYDIGTGTYKNGTRQEKKNHNFSHSFETPIMLL
jgi:hypothetical protein